MEKIDPSPEPAIWPAEKVASATAPTVHSIPVLATHLPVVESFVVISKAILLTSPEVMTLLALIVNVTVPAAASRPEALEANTVESSASINLNIARSVVVAVNPVGKPLFEVKTRVFKVMSEVVP